jgi:outer membrane receptor for ferrienterochelin and colicin
VKRDGFRDEGRTVNVLLGPAVTVNVTLVIAKGNTTVEVTDDAPLIHAENGDVSTTMGQRQISELPNPGNDLTYIAQTAPGAIMQTDFPASPNFSILGMSGTSYLYTIDGMSDNESGWNLSQFGPLGLLLGQNQIEEATVVSTGYSGQFGGAAGGNINYITKSGGNEFHGNARYYWLSSGQGTTKL